MGRHRSLKTMHCSVAIIVDGKDEEWYLSKAKAHYQRQCPALRRISIKPDLPQKKKIDELFGEAERKVGEGYSQVMLIIDFDDPLHKPEEMRKFRLWYDRYLSAREGRQTGRQKTAYGWMSRLLVVVNNPCLEYWYLLHHRQTSKFYSDYESLRKDIVKLPGMEGYEKNETYYNRTPDIYERLGGDAGLATARSNARSFSLDLATTEGTSEMNQIFDWLDSQQ